MGMTCHFCEDIFQKNRDLGLPVEDSIIYEDNNIYVMPDICPLTVGHLLIITKKHFQGYANAENEVLHSVERFLCCYEEKTEGRSYTVFEHGAVMPSTAGASVDHAHIHIVPFRLEMHELLKGFFPDYCQKELVGLAEYAERNQPYLFYKAKGDESGYVYRVGGMESQFLRKVAAKLINQKEDYDWKIAYRGAEAYTDFCNTLAWWKGLSYSITFKWKKKLILEKYNLLSYKELLNEIHRFKTDEKNIVMKLLEKELEKGNGQYSRLILVPDRHRYKLPNYIVEKQEDLAGAKEFLSHAGEFEEIWHLTGSREGGLLEGTGKEGGKKCFSGRISYSRDDYGWMEIVEMVSGDDPRQLERYSMESDKIDYIRAIKTGVESVYRIDSIHVGAQYKGIREWIHCFEQLNEELNKHYEGLYRLRRMISHHGVYSLSLDFRVKENKISFLDWDTSADEKILENESI